MLWTDITLYLGQRTEVKREDVGFLLGELRVIDQWLKLKASQEQH